MNKPISQSHVDFSKGPLFIRSADNDQFALTVKPGSTAVSLQPVNSGDWNTPESQWVFESVTASLFRISLFSSSMKLCLTGAPAAGAPVTAAPPSPTAARQLWAIGDNEKHPSWKYLHCEDVNLDLGFPGYIPMADLGLVVTTKHNDHDLGDCFTISAVF